MPPSPSIFVLAGPNGAGKTTVSRDVLAGTLSITQFVNADAIAAGLSGFAPDRTAFAAGRIMLARLRELAQARQSFAFESTLASRTFEPWLRSLVNEGYLVNIVYVWLRSPQLAVSRVRTRVREGGHGIPADVVTRRYYRSLVNFWTLYRTVATTWRVYDNSAPMPTLMAAGRYDKVSAASRTFLRSVDRAIEKAKGSDRDHA
ncbi:MAG: zeta toxin family protein [Phycisphaerales bacterium]|nr:zeta toxin family protein [Phycisphaerales bacterium]